MFKRLWRRLMVRPGEPSCSTSFDKRLDELQFAVGRITSDLVAISRELAGMSYEIKIEKVCVDKVNLDQIVFNIDGMDVKDLSGSLSIGLNYGGKVIRLETPGKKKPEAPPEEQPGKSSSPAGGKPQINIDFGSGSGGGDSNGRKTQSL